MIDRKALDKYLVIAREAALTAGEFLSGYKQSNILVESKKGKDIKISADRESEKITIDSLRSKSDFAILSEERGLIESDAEDDTLKWIIDPLDGSLNFFRGISVCCVSIGLWDGNTPLLGTIYDFKRKELFTGIAGVGAWLDENRVTVSKINTGQDAILFTGFPANTDFTSEALKRYIEQVQVFKKVRLMGSAALSLAYVAAGRADAYFERDIMIWDVAAGLAILSGAGGKYFIEPASHSNAYNVYATNGFLLNILGGRE